MTKRRDFIVAGIFGIGLQILPKDSFPATVPIDHSSMIVPVDQGNANLCWLAAAAMINSFQMKKPVSMEKAALLLGEPYVTKFRNTSQAALDFSLVDDLAAKLSMKAYGLASFDLDWWESKLSKGPLWVGGQDENGRMGHVKVIAGMIGDKKDIPALRIRGFDPAGAKKFEQSFRQFIAFYEGIPKKHSKLPNQIFAMP